MGSQRVGHDWVTSFHFTSLHFTSLQGTSNAKPSRHLPFANFWSGRAGHWKAKQKTSKTLTSFHRLMVLGASQVALMIEHLAANAGDMGSIPGSRRFPWSRTWQPTPVFLPGESHGQRSLAGYGPEGCRVKQDWSNLASMHGTGQTKRL